VARDAGPDVAVRCGHAAEPAEGFPGPAIQSAESTTFTVLRLRRRQLSREADMPEKPAQFDERLVGTPALTASHGNLLFKRPLKWPIREPRATYRIAKATSNAVRVVSSQGKITRIRTNGHCRALATQERRINESKFQVARMRNRIHQCSFDSRECPSGAGYTTVRTWVTCAYASSCDTLGC
jgi:hypothetical protein